MQVLFSINGFPLVDYFLLAKFWIPAPCDFKVSWSSLSTVCSSWHDI